MLEYTLWIVMILIAASILVCFIRVLIGPTMSDRVVALDTIGINLIGFTGIVIIAQETLAYVEVMLVLGILTFIGSIALAKFIERGVVIDRGRD